MYLWYDGLNIQRILKLMILMTLFIEDNKLAILYKIKWTNINFQTKNNILSMYHHFFKKSSLPPRRLLIPPQSPLPLSTILLLLCIIWILYKEKIIPFWPDCIDSSRHSGCYPRNDCCPPWATVTLWLFMYVGWQWGRKCWCSCCCRRICLMALRGWWVVGGVRLECPFSK